MLTPRPGSLALCSLILALASGAWAADAGTIQAPAPPAVKPVDIPAAVTFAALAESTGAAAPVAGRVLPPAGMAHLRATLIQHAATGKQPTTSAIIDDGATLVVTNRGDSSVSVFDAATLAPGTTITQVGYGAWGVIAKDANTLLVANWGGSTVALIDRKSGSRVGEIPVGMKPSYLALSPDKRLVFATGNFSGDVAISEVKSKRLMRTLEVGRRPMGLAASPDGRWLYVASCESRLIAKVDLKHEVVLERFGAPLASTTNVVLSADGGTLLAASDDGRLIVMDTATGDKSYAKVGRDAACVALTPDGTTAFVANYGEDTVSIVDMRSLETYDHIAVGHGPIDVQTDGKRLFVCNDKAGSVSAFRLDPIGAAGVAKIGM